MTSLLLLSLNFSNKHHPAHSLHMWPVNCLHSVKIFPLKPCGHIQVQCPTVTQAAQPRDPRHQNPTRKGLEMYYMANQPWSIFITLDNSGCLPGPRFLYVTWKFKNTFILSTEVMLTDRAPPTCKAIYKLDIKSIVENIKRAFLQFEGPAFTPLLVKLLSLLNFLLPSQNRLIH